MARETKVQREERLAAEREQRLQEQKAAYPSRLMSAFERLSNQYNFELTVVDAVFLVRDANSRAYSDNKEYRMSYAYDAVSQENLEDLEYMLTDLEEEQAEARRQAAVKAEAQRKVRELLSDEERALLGL